MSSVPMTADWLLAEKIVQYVHDNATDGNKLDDLIADGGVTVKDGLAQYVEALIDAAAQQERARVAELEKALERIVEWADAYPLTVFPEPDFKRAHELLKGGGMTLDGISASNMRHVIKGAGDIARAALAATPKAASGAGEKPAKPVCKGEDFCECNGSCR